IGEPAGSLVIPMPDLHFVSPGTSLPQPVDTTTTAPVTIPLINFGEDNFQNPGDSITSTYLSLVSTNVTNALPTTPITVGQQHFLLDTGAQLTVLSTALAESLGLDLDNPEMTITVGGVGGQVDIPGYTLSELAIPTADPDTVLQFTNVPVFILDVDPSI